MAPLQALFQSVNEVPYLVHPQAIGTVNEPIAGLDIRPVVVIRELIEEELVHKIENLLRKIALLDDVFSDGFATIAIVQTGATGIADELVSLLKTTGYFETVYCSYAESPVDVLPSAPYFLHGYNIHQAWRLYPDDLDAFICSVIPEDVWEPKCYTAVESRTEDHLWRNVAVPSRLYANPSADKPLAGARMGLKDIFRLKGTKVTMMNRSYMELYSTDEESADYVKKLVDLGAVIVGKTKMTSFASPEEPTDQWIDFHCPFNPRGDNYQSPSSSSTGAAVALAGYSWLDYSVAGDSAGSVRAPAPCNGLFALRPSFDSTSMRGIPVNSPAFDVIGQFSRDLEDLHHIVSKTFDLNDCPTQLPTQILYPQDFFPLDNQEQQEMVEHFVSILERFLNTKRTEFSIVESWSAFPPKTANKKPLNEFLKKSAFSALCYDYYYGFEDFRNQYRAKFDKKAYIGPVVRFRWNIGKDVTDEEYQTHLDELRVFRDWFREHFMASDPHTLSNAVMIMPYGSPDPEYRDDRNVIPGVFSSIDKKFISPILHAPQLVLPIGQMPYQSRISGRLEYRPIVSTLIGAKGSDLMLIKLAKAALESASWPTTIETGRFMYPLSPDNVRNVADVVDPRQPRDSYLRRRAAIQAAVQGNPCNYESSFPPVDALICNTAKVSSPPTSLEKRLHKQDIEVNGNSCFERGLHEQDIKANGKSRFLS